MRVIAWPDLVARLTARAELRLALARTPGGRSASFDGMLAARLAAGTFDAAFDTREINPIALGHGKHPRGKDVAAAGGAVSNDRETR